jgi:hypothetical protein
MNGGLASERTLNVKRTGMTLTSFQIGNTGAPGNVKLANDLTTQANFTVKSNSIFNVANYNITAGPVVIESGANLTYTGGFDIGVINATNLTLSNFVLNINRDASWPNGFNMVLFTYSGSLIGTPSITLGNVPAEFTYDALTTGGGVVQLTNVFLPEPAGVGAMMLAAGMMLCRRRHRSS